MSKPPDTATGSANPYNLPEVRPPADFILVQKNEISDALIFQNTQYLKNLSKAGLTVEAVDGVKYTDCIFIKLSATEDSFKHLATVHGLFPTYQRDRTIPHYTKWFSFFKTKISLKPNFQDPVFRRCSNSVRGQENTTFTSAERITLISYVLERTKYGRLPDEYGLGSLLANKNFDDAYPLHDGPAKWSEDGPLNDRQILARYWANWFKFYKYQPIHIIYKYYGSEIAFFYAWLQFYTKLVIIPAIMGLLTILISYFDLNVAPQWYQPHRVDEVCDSDKFICPTCTDSHCGYTVLSDYCSVAETVYYLDNNYTVALAIFMTIWATLFLELWGREECIWQYRWNLNQSIPEIDEMANYKLRVKDYTKYNIYTQSESHYTPFKMKLPPILVSIVVVTTGVIILVITTGLILISEYIISYYLLKYQVQIAVDHMLFIMRIYNCLCTIILIKTYTPLINRVSKVLTDKEIHRSKNHYITAYIFKSYVLNFFNTYLMSFYNSFVKETMYTNPGDYDLFNSIYGVRAALCPPAVGCSFGLFLSISFNIMKEYILCFFLNSYLMSHFIEGCKFIHQYIYKKLTKRKTELLAVPQWEEEYKLKPISPTYFCDAFVDLVMEYGLFVFYSATVPVLPVLVLLNNIVEIRVTARTLLRRSRRNIPKRVLGLGAWKTVLRIVTRLCYLISGGVVCFTSTFIQRTVYFFNNDFSMKGFVNETLTAFYVGDFDDETKQNLQNKFPNVTVCYFNGLKNGFNESTPYEKGYRYSHMLAMKFASIVIYVHAVYFFTSIISFYIPKVPTIITESQAYDDMLKRTEEMDKIIGTKTGKA